MAGGGRSWVVKPDFPTGHDRPQETVLPSEPGERAILLPKDAWTACRYCGLHVLNSKSRYVHEKRCKLKH